MPCAALATTPQARARQQSAIERLDKALGNNEAQLVVGASGSIAFKGWTEREGIADLCAYRRLAASNSPALRRAIMRAEAMSGRKIDPRAIASGMHSHDQGATWSTH